MSRNNWYKAYTTAEEDTAEAVPVQTYDNALSNKIDAFMVLLNSTLHKSAAQQPQDQPAHSNGNSMQNLSPKSDETAEVIAQMKEFLAAAVDSLQIKSQDASSDSQSTKCTAKQLDALEAKFAELAIKKSDDSSCQELKSLFLSVFHHDQIKIHAGLLYKEYIERINVLDFALHKEVAETAKARIKQNIDLIEGKKWGVSETKNALNGQGDKYSALVDLRTQCKYGANKFNKVQMKMTPEMQDLISQCTECGPQDDVQHICNVLLYTGMTEVENALWNEIDA